MGSKLKTIDGLVVYWITHILVIALLYLLVNQPVKLVDPGSWILLLWMFFVLSVPSLLTMILVHFLLFTVEQKHKRYGIRLMSWIAFLITLELWKATDGQTNFLDPYFQETFGWAAALLALSHILAYQLIQRIKKRKNPTAINS